jgi:hypothetical protein
MRLAEVEAFEGIVRGSIGLIRVWNWVDRSKDRNERDVVTHRLQEAKPQTVGFPRVKALPP